MSSECLPSAHNRAWRSVSLASYCCCSASASSRFQPKVSARIELPQVDRAAGRDLRSRSLSRSLILRCGHSATSCSPGSRRWRVCRTQDTVVHRRPMPARRDGEPSGITITRPAWHSRSARARTGVPSPSPDGRASAAGRPNGATPRGTPRGQTGHLGCERDEVIRGRAGVRVSVEPGGLDGPEGRRPDLLPKRIQGERALVVDGRRHRRTGAPGVGRVGRPHPASPGHPGRSRASGPRMLSGSHPVVACPQPLVERRVPLAQPLLVPPRQRDRVAEPLVGGLVDHEAAPSAIGQPRVEHPGIGEDERLPLEDRIGRRRAPPSGCPASRRVRPADGRSQPAHGIIRGPPAGAARARPGRRAPTNAGAVHPPGRPR